MLSESLTGHFSQMFPQNSPTSRQKFIRTLPTSLLWYKKDFKLPTLKSGMLQRITIVLVTPGSPPGKRWHAKLVFAHHQYPTVKLCPTCKQAECHPNTWVWISAANRPSTSIKCDSYGQESQPREPKQLSLLS